MKTTLTMNAREQKMTLVVDWQNGRIGKHHSGDEAENAVNSSKRSFAKQAVGLQS